jgi:lipoate-protein ligase A
MTPDRLYEDFLQRLGECVLICDGAHIGVENMQRDVQLAESLIASPTDRSIVVRFYWWKPWCISIGNTQPESDIALEQAGADGIDVVRRPTGGRAILHATELTYALVMRLGGGLTHRHVYHFWHQWLAHALATTLSITGLTFARTQPGFPVLLNRAPTRWLCFASSARYELLWHGRKVLGSAQRLYGDVLLQHGSLLLGSGHERLPYYVRDCSNPADVAAYLARRSVTLAEICGRELTATELQNMLATALRSTPITATTVPESS